MVGHFLLRIGTRWRDNEGGKTTLGVLQLALQKILFSFPVVLLWNTCACCSWIYITYRTLKRKDSNNNVFTYFIVFMFISMKLNPGLVPRKINHIFIHTSLLYSNLALLSLAFVFVVVFY